MSEFKQYRRTSISEMRRVTEFEMNNFVGGKLIFSEGGGFNVEVSISEQDRTNGSPRIGDMIARNPKNHNDQWLVAEQYFKDNLEPIEDDE